MCVCVCVCVRATLKEDSEMTQKRLEAAAAAAKSDLHEAKDHYERWREQYLEQISLRERAVTRAQQSPSFVLCFVEHIKARMFAARNEYQRALGMHLVGFLLLVNVHLSGFQSDPQIMPDEKHVLASQVLLPCRNMSAVQVCYQ